MKLNYLSIIAGLATAFSVFSCGKAVEKVDIIPYPNSVEIHCGTFKAAGAAFYVSPEFCDYSKAAVKGFASQLSLVSGVESVVAEEFAGKGFSFEFDSAIPAEGYAIEVKSSKVLVRASSLNGLLYSIETLKQMLPVEIYASAANQNIDWSIPCVSINDAPRFGYRGQHIDVARHFYDKAEMMKVIDMMLTHKMNTLHWHLTDDQGWRIEIKKYPKLTSVGSWRDGTCIGKDWESSDGIRYGGFYTQDDIREIIDYAASKGITVIPEIDLPGHMLAALTAYPQYGCTGGPYKVWKRWGVADDVLCAGNEKAMRFLEDILAEVAELFPAEYIHIGGDECPKVRWEKCPVCQKKIKELGLKDKDGYSAEHYLQSYVMERMENFLAEKGKKIIGWDEVLEGKPGPNATIMSWRGSEGGIKASKMGHDVIMTPNSHFYFDYYQAKDTDNEPLAIGGYLPIELVYAYEPYTEDMDENARGHILGIQANLWTEYIKTNEHLEYMLYPRQAALCEVQWCAPENKNWERFLSSLSREAAMYDILGYNYAKTAFQVISDIKVNTEKGCTEVSLTTQGDAPIRYTLDGTEPNANSTLYTKPLEVRSACTVKAIVERDNMNCRTYSQAFCDNKAMGKEIVLNTQPREKYRYGAPYSFVDGIRAQLPYSSGQWAGWFGEPLSATINMGGECEYSSVVLGCMSIQDEDIFPPVALAVSVSEDGKEFTEIASMDIPMEAPKTKDGIREYAITFGATSAKYIKVEAVTLAQLPSWHGRGGSPAFLFVDEIVVK